MFYRDFPPNFLSHRDLRNTNPLTVRSSIKPWLLKQDQTKETDRKHCLKDFRGKKTDGNT